MSLFYDMIALLTKIALLSLARWEVRFQGEIPKKGPLIVVANHLSMVDPPLLSASLPRRLAFMTKEEVFRWPVMGLMARAFGAFPVRRGRLDRAALTRAEQAMENGWALAVFPEGTRGRGQLRQARPGAVLLALKTGSPLLPVGIVGTNRIGGPLGILRRPRIIVTIGPPFSLPPPQGKLDREKLQDLADRLMEHIAPLLPEGQRGAYATGDERRRASLLTQG